MELGYQSLSKETLQNNCNIRLLLSALQLGPLTAIVPYIKLSGGKDPFLVRSEAL